MSFAVPPPLTGAAIKARLEAVGGVPFGTGSAEQITTWVDSATVGGSAALAYDVSEKQLTLTDSSSFVKLDCSSDATGAVAYRMEADGASFEMAVGGSANPFAGARDRLVWIDNNAVAARMQLDALGTLAILNGRASTSPTTGAFVTAGAGGAGIGGALYVGGGFNVLDSNVNLFTDDNNLWLDNSNSAAAAQIVFRNDADNTMGMGFGGSAVGGDFQDAFYVGSAGSAYFTIDRATGSAAFLADVILGGVLSKGGNQLVTARQTGWGAPTGTATRTTFDTATVTLAQLAERMHALIDDLTTHGLIGA